VSGGRSFAAGSRTLALGAAGFGLLVGIWEIVARAGAFGGLVPSVGNVGKSLVDDRVIFWHAFRATFDASAKGFLIGMGIGLALAVVGALVPVLSAGIGRLATLVNSIPWIALGPLIVVSISVTEVPTIIAALAVFFTSYVSVSSGFSFASATHEDLFTALGAGRISRLWRLQLPAAVPSIVNGAKLGAPAAVIGAVFGEWFGSTRGLGVLIVTSLQLFLPARLWAAALLTTVIALLAYGVLALVERAAEARLR
jgi:NitT/TauT family transport system permease protein